MKNSQQKLTLKVLTYNVHGCKGTDGRVLTDRIAKVISQYEPDVVCLQELDLNRKRSGGMDQPHRIAQHLEMMYHFYPSMQIEEEQYGNAILSRYPMQLIKAEKLPNISGKGKNESRGALWVSIKIQDIAVQLFNTHLSLFRNERILQMDTLLSDGWLKNQKCLGPAVVCGDFNAWTCSSAYHKIRRVLNDVQILKSSHRLKATWHSLFPFSRIDHIFVSLGIEVQEVLVPNTKLTRQASDHLPLIAELKIKSKTL